MTNYTGLYLPKVFEGNLNLASGPVEVSIAPAGKYVFFGLLNFKLQVGATLTKVELYLELLRTYNSSPVKYYADLTKALQQVSANEYQITSEHFGSSGSIELSLSGFRVTGTGNLSWTLFCSAPIISFVEP